MLGDNGAATGNAVVRLGKRTMRLTAALTAAELIVGEPGPAQRHLLDKYQASTDEHRLELRRMWAVALCRAQGVDWLKIAEALGIEDPSKYQSRAIWRDVYEAAEEATLGEGASDAIASLRKLARRGRSEYVRAAAAKALLDARSKQWTQRTETTHTLDDDLSPETRALIDQIRKIPAGELRALLAKPATTEPACLLPAS